MDAIAAAAVVLVLAGVGEPGRGSVGRDDALHQAINQEAERLAKQSDADQAMRAAREWESTMWGRVRGIRPTAKIDIKIRDQPTVRRWFLRADDTTLEVADPSNRTILKIARAEVVSIDAPVYRRGSRKDARLGILAGIVATALIILPQCDGASCEGAGFAAAAYGAPIGGTIGYFAVERSTMRRIYTRE